MHMFVKRMYTNTFCEGKYLAKLCILTKTEYKIMFLKESSHKNADKFSWGLNEKTQTCRNVKKWISEWKNENLGEPYMKQLSLILDVLSQVLWSSESNMQLCGVDGLENHLETSITAECCCKDLDWSKDLGSCEPLTCISFPDFQPISGCNSRCQLLPINFAVLGTKFLEGPSPLKVNLPILGELASIIAFWGKIGGNAAKGFFCVRAPWTW